MNTSQDCPDAREQFVEREWLRYVIVGSQAQSLKLVFLLACAP